MAEEKTPAPRIFTREEILSEITHHCKNFTVKRELSNEDGIYLLEVEEKGHAPGDDVEYIYQREGVFPNKNESSTLIHVIYSKGGVPVSGYNVSEYDPKTREWVRIY